MRSVTDKEYSALSAMDKAYIATVLQCGANARRAVRFIDKTRVRKAMESLPHSGYETVAQMNEIIALSDKRANLCFLIETLNKIASEFEEDWKILVEHTVSGRCFTEIAERNELRRAVCFLKYKKAALEFKRKLDSRGLNSKWFKDFYFDQRWIVEAFRRNLGEKRSDAREKEAISR